MFKHTKHTRRLLIIPMILLLTTCILAIWCHYISPVDYDQYHADLLHTIEHATSFSEYTDALFCYEVTSDSITTAYTLQNPQSFDIPKLPACLSSFSARQYESQKKNHTEENKIDLFLTRLHQYAATPLTKQETLTYDLLNKRLTLNKKLSTYAYYDDLLGPSSGIPSNLPVTLCEYPLHSESDVNTYLSLLKQMPQYFSNVIQYENARIDHGYITPDFVKYDTLDHLSTFIQSLSKSNNCFSETFLERIHNIQSLSAKEEQSYINEHNQILTDCITPAFQTLYDYIQSSLTEPTKYVQLKESSARNSKYIPDSQTSYGLSSLPNGKEYYTLLVESNTGSSKSPKDLITLTESTLQSTLSNVKNIALTEPDTYLYYCDHTAESYYQSPEAILEALSLMIRKDYPSLPQTPEYTVKSVPKSMEAQLSPAFYMIPTIDDFHHNTIYINNLYTNTEAGNLFTTLAHEGFPGHLYQTVYFNGSSPCTIRHMLDYPGYVEGWATYVELLAFSYMHLPEDKPSLCSLYQSDTIISLALSSRVDLGVNYENWTLDDVNQFFNANGFQSYYAADLYSYVVECPATYLRYFIGYLEIEQLKQDFKNQEMENYSDLLFHKKLLDIGPSDFDTLRKYILKNP
ncbi:MAG: DUF885 domain-containing protein [Eubacteriales bacterium]|nr:DUF885 domain-containing protein [Eubacteriales bacterium]